MRQVFIVVYAFVFSMLTGCSHRNWSVESNAFSYYKIVDTLSADQHVLEMIAPYKTGLDSQMGRVLGHTDHTLLKARPEGTLGNWMADVCRNSASQKLGKPVDAAILNHGGIRIPEIHAGEVKVGQVYELMPFDNEVVVVKMSGETLKKLAKLIVSKGGDPVSGLRIHSRDTTMEVWVNGQPLVLSGMYTVATTDYLYNGGDSYGIFKEGVEVIFLRELLRDCLVKSFETNVSPVYMETEGRVEID